MADKHRFSRIGGALTGRAFPAAVPPKALTPVDRVRTGIADNAHTGFAFRGFSLGLSRSWFRTALARDAT
jgi:hypothetical protein